MGIGGIVSEFPLKFFSEFGHARVEEIEPQVEEISFLFLVLYHQFVSFRCVIFSILLKSGLQHRNFSPGQYHAEDLGANT